MKTSRNAPCHCGSGKKYKKCCLIADEVEKGGAITAPTPGDSRHSLLRLVDMQRISGRMGGKRAKRSSGMWTPHQVSRMETNAILAELRRLGVKVDEETFRSLTGGLDSAWPIGQRWKREIGRRIGDQDEDFMALAAANLWRRWVPKKLCFEAVDDWMQEGYVLQYEGANDRDVAEHWIGLWEVLREQWIPGTRTTDELDRKLAGTQHPGNWLQDMSIALLNAGIDDRDMARRGADVLEQVMETFEGEDDSWRATFEEDRAQMLFNAGRRNLAEPILRKLIDAGPRYPSPYMRLAEGLTDAGDLREAIEVLREAKSRYRDADEFGVGMLLADLEKRVANG